MKDLTPTSFAILAHLAVQPWSAYELAMQMTRGMGLIWPRAVSAIYVEPKVLAEHGYARASEHRAGKRSRTVYSITDEGRIALARWLEAAPSSPSFSSEAMVRVFFAEHGTREAFLGNIRSIAEHGRSVMAHVVEQQRGYVETGGPFSERYHVIAIGARFLMMYASVLIAWSEWAEAEVSTWKSMTDGRDRGLATLRESLRMFAEP
jgi:DNA-binding PadR family transcriptional regulator